MAGVLGSTCGDKEWGTLPGGQTYFSPCATAGGSVCNFTDCQAWEAQIARLSVSMLQLRAQAVPLASSSPQVAKALADVAKWYARRLQLPSCSIAPWATIEQAPNRWAPTAATLVADGACVLQQLQQALQGAGVTPTPTPGPPPGTPLPWDPSASGDPWAMLGLGSAAALAVVVALLLFMGDR